ncbi:MAG: type III-B CRISPR-associated protein Cas10/Cmr2 [Bacillota bacterium]
MRKLHFTLGPVQSFVAQSRRTRDLLAGSFLLSYLAGHAMVAVIQGGGRIQFPQVHGEGAEQVKDELLQAILESLKGLPTKGPWKGSLPNRFQAKVPENFDPNACVEAVHKAWGKVADAVWRHVVEKAELYGCKTREIWNRQVGKFWDIAWVLDQGDLDNGDLLDRRKNWRSYVPTVEPGDKCTLIGHLQELSGWLRIRERTKQEKFWSVVREAAGGLDLQENERLSAVGLIKRLFPRFAEESIGWKFPETAIHFPSTSYMSALPWINRAIREEPKKALALVEAAQSTRTIKKVGNGERFPLLKEAVSGQDSLKDFACLDASCFFRSNLENENFWNEADDQEKREAVKKALFELTEALKESPRPYYALLLMDGDRLGKLLREIGGERVSQALAQFTKKVDRIITDHNGAPIYVGGDDVLALLPLDHALDAVVEVRSAYLESFAKEGRNCDSATISAAIIYAHTKAPLKGVLEHAHFLLDKVAKDQTGRDSLAVCVWKGGGPTITWSAPWKVVCGGSWRKSGDPTDLQRLVEEFRNMVYSGSFFYKLKEQFEVIGSNHAEEEDLVEFLTKLITADYLRILEDRQTLNVGTAEMRIRRLVEFCLRNRRDEHGSIERELPFRADAALLIRFLGQRGGEEA